MSIAVLFEVKFIVQLLLLLKGKIRNSIRIPLEMEGVASLLDMLDKCSKFLKCPTH